jgi:predicted aspartyl protease
VAAAPAAAGEMIEVPLEEAHGLLFARGALNDAPVRWLLDTGARATVVPPGLAEAAGLVLADGAADTLRGMDGHPIAAPRARPATLRVGEAGFPEQTVAVADLPVLGAMGLAAEAALLGQPFWRGFETVEVDFRAGVLRLGAARSATGSSRRGSEGRP